LGKLLYRIGIWLYYTAAKFTSPFSTKSRKFYLGSSRAIRELAEKVKNFKEPPAWFHCASLGEFEQAKPLIELLHNSFPETPIVVTFFSPSGYENAGDYPVASAIGYIPRDTRKNAVNFIDILNPRVAIFIRYEFWYYLMKRTVDLEIPIISVSADFRPSQVFFRKGSSFYIDLLQELTHIFLQNKQSQELLQKYNIKNTTVIGDSRFDRVSAIASKEVRIPQLERWLGESKAIVIGSAWPSDMEILYEVINKKTDYKFIIAPHELDQKFYSEIEHSVESKISYYSQGADSSSVLILDTIGMLSKVYSYATYSYVGGGLGPGVHSVLEPAAFGQPVFYGNRNYERWRESVHLAQAKAGFPVGTSQEVLDQITQFENNPDYYNETSQRAREFIAANSGASEQVLNHIKKLL